MLQPRQMLHKQSPPYYEPQFPEFKPQPPATVDHVMLSNVPRSAASVPPPKAAPAFPKMAKPEVTCSIVSGEDARKRDQKSQDKAESLLAVTAPATPTKQKPQFLPKRPPTV